MMNQVLHSHGVIPAQAGISVSPCFSNVDSRLRGNDPVLGKEIAS